MSEVKRYVFQHVVRDGTSRSFTKKVQQFTLADDFDRVTAERDAALGREAAFNRQISNQAETIKQLSGRYGPIAEALQQRLTAADERAAVLEGLLRKSLRSLVPRMSPALIQDIKAALKPAEGGGDE